MITILIHTVNIHNVAIFKVMLHALHKENPNLSFIHCLLKVSLDQGLFNLQSYRVNIHLFWPLNLIKTISKDMEAKHKHLEIECLCVGRNSLEQLVSLHPINHHINDLLGGACCVGICLCMFRTCSVQNPNRCEELLMSRAVQNASDKV